MTRYAIVSDGCVINIVVSETAIEPDWIQNPPNTVNIGDRFVDGNFVKSPTQAITSTKITQLAFLNRFTDDEAVDIDLASMGTTRDAALLRRYLQKVNAATHIDLSRTDLAEDLQKLVTFNILTQERVTTILTSPIQDHEIYKG